MQETLEIAFTLVSEEEVLLLLRLCAGCVAAGSSPSWVPLLRKEVPCIKPHTTSNSKELPREFC